MRTGDGKNVVRVDDFAAERRWDLLIAAPDCQDSRARCPAEIQLREAAADSDAFRYDPNRNRLAQTRKDRVDIFELCLFLRFTG